jgi:hypothetical protein
MPRVKMIATCLLAGVATAFGMAALTCLYLMATSEGATFKRTALFGSVFFSSHQQADGSLNVGAGIENVVPLLVLAGVLGCFFMVVHGFYRGLVERKRRLTRR